MDKLITNAIEKKGDMRIALHCGSCQEELPMVCPAQVCPQCGALNNWKGVQP